MSKKPAPAPATCDRCRHCHPVEGNPEHGACYRFPPTPLMRVDGQITYAYPIVIRAKFLCGEFGFGGK